MSRYQNPDDDVLNVVARLARRIANLEKANPLNYGTIDEGGLVIKNNGSIIVANALGEIETFIGEGRVDFADAGEVSGTIGEFIGEFFNNGIGDWVTATMRGISLYRPGLGNPYFSVARAVSSGFLECTFGYDGQAFEHWGVRSEFVHLRGGALINSDPSNAAVIQIQDDGDIFISAQALHSTFIQGGSVDINVTSDFDVDADNGISLTAPNGDISIDPQGIGDLKFFITTTTNPANLNQTGNIVKLVSSARKYKADIQDAVIDPADVLKLRPRTWLDKGDLTKWENDQNARAIAKSNGELAFIETPEVPYPKRTIGFVAEEIDDLSSLRPFVEYKDGKPESLYYDRMFAAAVTTMQSNNKRIVELETITKGQQTQIDELKALVETLLKKPK